jgi:hypothetical protein
MAKDDRTRKEKALDKLGEIVFGETGEEPVGEEVEREINKGHGSSGKGDPKDEGGKT